MADLSVPFKDADALKGVEEGNPEVMQVLLTPLHITSRRKSMSGADDLVSADST
jgi:hypothetical protein